MRRQTGIRNNQGFTLIEMTIVLVVIGIIIAAVVKGRDIVKSGEQKQLYTTYIRAWELSFSNYYDRTGWVLADDASDTNAVRDGRCSDAATEDNLLAQLRRVGLGAPNEGPTGDTLIRTYTDSQGINRSLQLKFDYKSNLGNFIRVTGISNDLGLAWDKIIDGTVDGEKGQLLYTSNHNLTTPAVSDWPAADATPRENASAILKLPF